MSRPVGWALQWGTLIRKLDPSGSLLRNCMLLMSFELAAETHVCDCVVNKGGVVAMKTHNRITCRSGSEVVTFWLTYV